MVRIKVEKEDDSYERSLVDVHGSTATKMKMLLENSAREIHQVFKHFIQLNELFRFSFESQQSTFLNWHR